MAFDYFSKTRMQYILTKIKGLFGQANCIASLDENAKLEESQLPSTVIQKSQTPGLVKNDGTIDTKDYAEKVSSATNGNLAGINGSGNLTDSEWNGAKDTTSISGNPISISGLKANQLAVNPIITLEPIQAGSGTPSPVNQRPISGYDKIEVLSCGKNILNPDYATTIVTVQGYDRNGVEFKNLSGTYTFSNASGSVTTYINYENNGTWTQVYITGSDTTRYKTFTVNGGIQIFVGSGSQFTSVINPQLEESASATTYEPCNKTTDLSLALGQTVYGGTLDVRKGVLLVDRVAIDMGSLSWSYVTTYDYPVFVGGGIPNDNIDFTKTQVILTCSCYEAIAGMGYASFRTNNYNNKITNITNQTVNNRVDVQDSRYTSAEAFKTAVTGQTLVYQLATPFEIQLTPHEISLLKDYAYVSINGTNIALDYHNGELASLADVAQLSQTVEELDRPQERTCQINITSYNTSSNRYAIPFDGYITASLPSETGYVRVTVYDHNEQTMGIYQKYAISGGDEYYTVFVKKGMKAMITASLGFSPTVTYRGMS